MPQVAINIDVAAMAPAIEFYTRALGCTVLDKGAEITKLEAGAATIFLLLKAPGTNALTVGHATRHYDRHWTPVHLDFSVPQLAPAIAKVVQGGGMHESSDAGPWGAIAYCADPFGNGFCLLQTEGFASPL